MANDFPHSCENMEPSSGGGSVVVVGRGITVASLINTPPSLSPSLHVLFLL